MKQPTHFIDLYKVDGRVNYSPLTHITGLPVVLYWSERNGIEIVAIWKIYPKTKPND